MDLMTYGRLTRLSDVPGHNMKTKSVQGHCPLPPMVGRSFIIINEEPLETSQGENCRIFTTSLVMKLLTEGTASTVEFETRSGTHYRLENLNMEETTSGDNGSDQ